MKQIVLSLLILTVLMNTESCSSSNETEKYEATIDSLKKEVIKHRAVADSATLTAVNQSEIAKKAYENASNSKSIPYSIVNRNEQDDFEYDKDIMVEYALLSLKEFEYMTNNRELLPNETDFIIERDLKIDSVIIIGKKVRDCDNSMINLIMVTIPSINMGSHEIYMSMKDRMFFRYLGRGSGILTARENLDRMRKADHILNATHVYTCD